MRKYGKYEKRPEPKAARVPKEKVNTKQPAAKSMLLQTYFTSLLSLVLCVTMFFGTSYAWFTSEVNNTGNEIYIGILDVDLRDAQGNSFEGNSRQLFDRNIQWEPGYTALETVRVVNEGNMDFYYELRFLEGENSVLGGLEIEDVAKWFDVWYYHDVNNTIPTSQVDTSNGWVKAGTLAEVMTNPDKCVFSGYMTKEEVTSADPVAHTYTIALRMNGEDMAEEEQDDFNLLMGKKISLNVKLVAYQGASVVNNTGTPEADPE